MSTRTLWIVHDFVLHTVLSYVPRSVDHIVYAAINSWAVFFISSCMCSLIFNSGANSDI